MKQAKSKSSQADKRLFIISLVVFAVTCLLVFSVITSQNRPSAVYVTSTPVQIMTLEPAVVANFTNVPPTLTGEIGVQLDDIERMLNACPDYSDERRSQMEQHIAWLRNPAQIPPDLVLAFGAEPSGRLIFGMSTYTLIEWSLRDRSLSSCLLPIGQLLNEMLIAVGETPVTEFGD
jgi:hypothetical protein